MHQNREKRVLWKTGHFWISKILSLESPIENLKDTGSKEKYLTIFSCIPSFNKKSIFFELWFFDWWKVEISFTYYVIFRLSEVISEWGWYILVRHLIPSRLIPHLPIFKIIIPKIGILDPTQKRSKSQNLEFSQI